MLPLRVWLCVYFVNINFIGIAGVSAKPASLMCQVRECAFIFSEGCKRQMIQLPPPQFPKRTHQKMKYDFVSGREKNVAARLSHRLEVHRQPIIFFCRRVFCLRFLRFTEKNVSCRRTQGRVNGKSGCIGVDKMCGVRLNTCRTLGTDAFTILE